MPWYKQWRTLVPLLTLLITSATYSQSGGTADQQSSTPQQQEAAVSPSNNVLRATTRLVVVDVVTVDSKGEPVPDLKADDFTLLEDGKPQKISGFSFQRGTATQIAASANTGGFSNAPQYKNVSSLNVILLDAVNGNFAGRAYGRDQLLMFLDKGTLTQPTALYALEEKLTLLHDFTTDIKVLRSLVQDYKPKGAARVQDVYSAASPFSARAPSNATTSHTIDVTIAALNSLARALAGYPGRKNLIWISEGFPITLFPEIIYDESMPFGAKPISPAPPTMAMSKSFSIGSGKDLDAEVEKVANALMNAQVAMYPVDSSGLGKDNHLNRINTMRSLADRTGGKAFYNRNDVDLGISGSLDDGSTYYTLEYYPANKTWDGKFRVIQIKGPAGLSLRYRQGYYALDPGVQNKDADKALAKTFSDALSLDSPSATGVVFRAGVIPPSAKEKQVTVNFAIDPHTLGFERKDDGLQHIMVSCAVAAFSEKGSFVKEEVSNMTAAMKADEFDKMMKGQQFPCRRTIDLKPGNYNLTLGVVDRNSRFIGTTTAWVKVP